MEIEVVYGAIVVPVCRENDGGQVWILLQRRNDPGPEGIDHGRLGVMSETFNPALDSNTFATGIRGCREEFCLPELAVDLIGRDGALAYLLKHDLDQPDQIANPYSSYHGQRVDASGRVLSLHAENYVAIFGEKIVPQANEEAYGFEWVRLCDMPERLWHPEDFTFTYMSLREICNDLIAGRLKFR